MTPAAIARARARSSTALGAIVLTAALAFTYLPVARELVALWRENPYYAYGFMIPLFSASLVWSAARRLAAPAATDARGLLLIAAGLAMLLLGAEMSSLTVKTLSVPVTLAGLALFALGPDRFRAVAAPIAFLALMTPLPAGVIPTLSLPMQYLAAAFTTGVLHAAGIAAMRDGLVIRLDGLDVVVSEGCNGLRFLLAMTVVGIAFAWLTQSRTRARLAVLVTALGAAILANMLRVAGTALIAHAWGPGAASGWLHIAYGKVVYALMLVPFVSVVLVLRRDDAAARETASSVTAASGTSTDPAV